MKCSVFSALYLVGICLSCVNFGHHSGALGSVTSVEVQPGSCSSINVSIVDQITSLAKQLQRSAHDTSTGAKPLWLVGPESTTVDDARSIVDCPSTHYLSQCSCVDPNNCDGSRVIPGDIRRCIATHRAFISSKTKAIAQCRPLSNCLSVVTMIKEKPENQYTNCPTGYELESCFIVDAWSQYRDTLILKTDQGCAWTKGRYNTRTRPNQAMSLICVKHTK